MQFAEESLPTPEVQDLNPVIVKFLFGSFVCCQQQHRNDENKEKETGNGPFLNRVTRFIEWALINSWEVRVTGFGLKGCRKLELEKTTKLKEEVVQL